MENMFSISFWEHRMKNGKQLVHFENQSVKFVPAITASSARASSVLQKHGFNHSASV